MRQILTLSMFLWVFVACSKEEVVNDFVFDEYELGEKMTLQSINGEKLTFVRAKKGFVIENNEDKVVMIDFFGTFCAPCKEEAAHLTQLYRKNAQKFILIGLTHFENVSDEVVRQFANDYGAYYFLSNSTQNARLIAQILKDIDYQNMEQLPFKVVFKNGVYQNLQDYWNKGSKVRFYLGKVPTELMQEDLDFIFGQDYAKN